MYKHLFINANTLTNDFEMDASPPKLIVGSFTSYRKELAVEMFFPYSTL